MSKRNKKSKNKIHFSEAEKLLTELHKLVRSGDDKAPEASSLIQWYMENKDWTSKQWNFVRVLAARGRSERKRKRVEKKWYLYAIRQDRSIKIGYSCNPKSRIKAMQTGNSSKLVLEWQYYTGRTEGGARDQEKKLHRLCKKFKIRGEWFKDECMEKVNGFSAREDMKREFHQRDVDMQILTEAEKYI